MLRNATDLCQQVVANATAVLAGLPNVTFYDTPAVPPVSGSTCAQHQGPYADCGPKCHNATTGHCGAPQCEKVGCCWEESSAHPWCFEQPAPTPPGVPDDGSVIQIPRKVGGQAVPVVAANSLAWTRTDVLSVRVNSTSPHLAVVDAAGNSVRSQLAPAEPTNASLDGQGGHAARHAKWVEWAAGRWHGHVVSRLLIEVNELPPLGAAAFYIRPVTAAAQDRAEVSRVELGDGTQGFRITNGHVLLEMNRAGLVDAVVDVASNTSLAVEQDFLLYWGNGGREAPGSAPDGSGGDGGSESDAYVFAPQGPASSLVRGGERGSEQDGGFWPTRCAQRQRRTSVACIQGGLMQEVSTAHNASYTGAGCLHDGSTLLWQAARVYNAEGRDTSKNTAIEMAYLVPPLQSNQDLVARFTTPMVTEGVLHADEAAYTNRAHARKLDYFDMQGRIGCNFVPSSGWAELVDTGGAASLSVLTDRARGVASLADGQLEYVLHRHATGGNGRGPSDGDSQAARGAVVVFAASNRPGFVAGRALRPALVLRVANPTAVLFGAAVAASTGGLSPRTTWTPMAKPLPSELHLLTLQRRAFLQKGSHLPDYLPGPAQGTLRVQHVYDRSLRASGRALPASFTLDGLFSMGPLESASCTRLDERTLSVARRASEVTRRSWRGAGAVTNLHTPAGWRFKPKDANATALVFSPTSIRTFTFNIKP